MRSMLFVPGDSEKKLEKGFGAEADVVIVDLEDSVAPHNKEAARAIAAAFIAARRQETGPAVYIRVNDLSTGLTDDDLAALVPARPDGIMLPKSNSGQDVQRLAAKLRVAEAEAGISDGTTRIVPIIRPSVNSELTRGLPHSLLAAKSKSICSGCGLSVITENSMLSLSVTVLRSAWL